MNQRRVVAVDHQDRALVGVVYQLGLPLSPIQAYCPRDVRNTPVTGTATGQPFERHEHTCGS